MREDELKIIKQHEYIAAKMFGLFLKKGTIAVASDADIVIFDAEKEHAFGVENEHMNVDYSSYEGWTVKGKVETVLSRGRVMIENGEHKGKAGDGQFLKRGTYDNTKLHK